MYSRQSSPRQHTSAWQIPRNYSGNAFSSSDGEIFDSSPQAEKSPEQQEAASHTEPSAAASARVETERKGNLFGLSRQGGGIGIEELLILGLVLLISGSDEGEGNNDLAFLLLLLLFIQ